MKAELGKGGETVHAPSVLDAEVVSAIRRKEMRGLLSRSRAQECVDDLKAFRVNRYLLPPFLQRVWYLRRNLTPFDAAYIVLAEVLQSPIYTVDPKLKDATGHKAEIRLLGAQ